MKSKESKIIETSLGNVQSSFTLSDFNMTDEEYIGKNCEASLSSDIK